MPCNTNMHVWFVALYIISKYFLGGLKLSLYFRINNRWLRFRSMLSVLFKIAPEHQAPQFSMLYIS